jgi:hypothetical protein
MTASAAAPPTLHAPTRPRRGARRVGYVATTAIDLLLLWLLHVAPGWEGLTFLTAEFAGVTGLLTASLVAGAVINLAYLAADPPWLKRLGDAATAALACAVLARVWSVFPFALTGGWVGWESTLRGVLLFLTIATAIAVLANLAELLRLVLGTASTARRD